MRSRAARRRAGARRSPRSAADASLEEIILSGGDPLSLSNARLESLTRALAAIPHVRRIRVHTRQPVVLPSRVDEGLLQWLRARVLPTVLVLHVNHPNELDAELVAACGKLRATGVTLLNQSVLLAGVNDDVEVLAQLSRRLFEAGVLPYYLHALDRVRGASHFAVPDERARALAGRTGCATAGISRAAPRARGAGCPRQNPRSAPYFETRDNRALLARARISAVFAPLPRRINGERIDRAEPSSAHRTVPHPGRGRGHQQHPAPRGPSGALHLDPGAARPARRPAADQPGAADRSCRRRRMTSRTSSTYGIRSHRPSRSSC